MVSWFKRGHRAPDESVQGESTTSNERSLPRNEDDHIVTERTRLLGRNVEPEIQPSPYNLVLVRSLRNISTPNRAGASSNWWQVSF